MAQIQGS